MPFVFPEFWWHSKFDGGQWQVKYELNVQVKGGFSFVGWTNGHKTAEQSSGTTWTGVPTQINPIARRFWPIGGQSSINYSSHQYYGGGWHIFIAFWKERRWRKAVRRVNLIGRASGTVRILVVSIFRVHILNLFAEQQLCSSSAADRKLISP